jgi:hypothetical protein
MYQLEEVGTRQSPCKRKCQRKRWQLGKKGQNYLMFILGEKLELVKGKRS